MSLYGIINIIIDITISISEMIGSVLGQRGKTLLRSFKCARAHHACSAAAERAQTHLLLLQLLLLFLQLLLLFLQILLLLFLQLLLLLL